MNKLIIAKVVFIVLCLTWSGYLFTRSYHKAHPQDCDHVKETCSRKKGCKCKLNCDPEGRRLPPAGGTAECPSYCCEQKCECHMPGCP